MNPFNIQDNVNRIKQTLRWFPGLVLGLGRKVGKTSALLEVIHDDFDGQAMVYSVHSALAKYAEQMYKDKYPGEHVPSFVSQPDRVRGRSDPIFVDEWWHIPTADRRNLVGTGRLAVRIGTEFGQRNLDSTVIRFTDEELDCLEAMFDVLINGGGNYIMIGLPESVKVHHDLHRKFKQEKDLV